MSAFEKAFARLFPGGDLDSIVNSLLQDQGSQPKTVSSPPSSTRNSSQARPDSKRSEPASEALPQQADGFDWAEKELAVGDLTDGMAALSIRPEGAGYFGKSSNYIISESSIQQVLTLCCRIFIQCGASSRPSRTWF